jgi:hypothetical protein
MSTQIPVSYDNFWGWVGIIVIIAHLQIKCRRQKERRKKERKEKGYVMGNLL